MTIVGRNNGNYHNCKARSEGRGVGSAEKLLGGEAGYLSSGGVVASTKNTSRRIGFALLTLLQVNSAITVADETQLVTREHCEDVCTVVAFDVGVEWGNGRS